ncbi:unnamed protein product [Cunninghamella echinulata]
MMIWKAVIGKINLMKIMNQFHSGVTMKKKSDHTTASDDIVVAGGELEGLKETAELSKSNIFKLELDELLNEIQPKYEKHAKLEKALHNLKGIFDSIPEGIDYLLNDFEEMMKKKHKIMVPYSHLVPPKDSQYKFKFIKPSAVHIVGSYALKTAIKTKTQINVDIAVEMPSSIFQEKDHMNHRYFYKRACYLSVLANAIVSSKKNFSVEYSILNGDRLKPILLVKSPEDKSDIDFSKTKSVIRIIPYIKDDVFPVQRLGPDRNCVRPKENETILPTPQYNASLLQDISYTTNLAFLYQHSKNCSGFKDAVILGKTWLYQRGLASIDQTQSGWNGFLFAMIMGYLLQNGPNKKLSNGHSSYQLLRGTIDFLANHNFETNPVFIGQSTHDEFSEEVFKKNYDVVIVDPSGTLNLANKLTKSGLNQLQYEAKLAMNYFNDSVDRFDPLFLKNVNNAKLRYDNTMNIMIPFTSTKLPIANFKTEYPFVSQYYAKKIGNILIKGLSNRVELVSVQHKISFDWPINAKDIKEHNKETMLTVGLVLNPDTSSRLVDQGPDAQDKEACKEFSEFWGNKSELRRFKDGSILESVVWECQGYEKKSLIVERIVRHLLGHHLKITSDSIRYWAGQLYSYINYSKHLPRNLFDPKMNALGFQPIISAFTQFAKQLRSVDDELPLLINNIYPLSSGLRQASLHIPHPVNFSNIDAYPTTTRYVPVLDVSVQLERSGKWPDDLAAMQKVKLAFYLKIAELFKQKFNSLCHVVHDVQATNPIGSPGYLDICFHGFVFRCHIHLEQEGELLSKLISNKTTPPQQLNLAKAALSSYQRLFQHRREHTFSIQALCARHPAFSSTMRLVKRWFGAHLLSAHVPEEIIELLCAYVFTEPQPWSVPVSTLTGFSRVLGLLAEWNWNEQPLIVDMDGKLTSKERETIMETFTTYHQQHHALGNDRAMTIATSNDMEGKRWWSNGMPSRAIAGRIQILARASCQVLENTVNDNDLASVFVTPMEDYDVVFKLNTSRCTRYYENMHPQRLFLQDSPDLSELGHSITAEFDPVTEFVKEIKNKYGNLIMVFYDKYGGDKLALVWNPLETTPHPWRVTANYNYVPVDMSKSGQLKPENGKSLSKLTCPNISAITAEIERLGDGIISQKL